ncbi:ABC transporter permease subunit [Chitinophaga sp. Mgbs1]|uniref:ABC transporter permease subunit n=1 Tax=Chitinophaga solisilvae TaxID=1233460 RepID=A0A433WDZ6_9BACT|nr:ABC transporter permease subunit [Chitinophaga solisilvae]
MKRIIYTEWLKVKNYRVFWVILVIAAIMIPAGSYVPAEIYTRQLKDAAKMLGQAPFSFPVVWQTVANISSYVTTLFGLLMVILVTNEYTFRTNRQNIIDGWDRKEFVYAKLFWVVALSLMAFLLSVLTACTYGFVYGDKPFSTENFIYLIYYWLQVVLTLCIALLLSVWVKRAGFAIVLFLGYTMMLEQTLVFMLKRSVGRIGGLLPLQTADELLPFPVVGKMISSADRYDDSIYLFGLLLYIAVVIYLVFRKILRSDL